MIDWPTLADFAFYFQVLTDYRWSMAKFDTPNSFHRLNLLPAKELQYTFPMSLNPGVQLLPSPITQEWLLSDRLTGPVDGDKQSRA